MIMKNIKYNRGLSWNDAELRCREFGGSLVSFTEKQELEWIQTWYTNTDPVWIGLNQNGNS